MPVATTPEASSAPTLMTSPPETARAGAERRVGGGVHARAGRSEELDQRERDERRRRLAQAQARPVHELAHRAL